MQNFEKTINLLDNMISELEISTGQAQSVSKEEKKVEQKVEQKEENKVEQKEEKKEEQKVEQKEEKKEENNQNKQINAEENKKEDDKKEKDSKKKEQQKKKGQEEKPKKAKKQAEPVKEMTDDDNFIMCDLRVGNITSCIKHPESEKLYIEQIDLGEGEDRTIASGLQQCIDINEVNGLCVVFANLKARPLGGVQSNGMVMCVKNKAGDIEIMRPPVGSQVGERVVLQGIHMLQQPLPKLNPKKKFAEKVLPLLHTNQQGECMFKDWKMMANGQVIQSNFINATIS